MSGELIVGGDAAPHRHDLPEIPTIPDRGEQIQLENAVARCLGCGWLFVSREDPDGWGRHVYWTRLRWWHRKAWAKLRQVEQPSAESDPAQDPPDADSRHSSW